MVLFRRASSRGGDVNCKCLSMHSFSSEEDLREREREKKDTLPCMSWDNLRRISVLNRNDIFYFIYSILYRYILVFCDVSYA